MLSNLDCSSHQNCRHANLFSDPESQVSHLHCIQKNKLNCHVTSKKENLDIFKILHLSLVSYINLFEQGRPTTLGDLLNHLENSFNLYLITSTYWSQLVEYFKQNLFVSLHKQFIHTYPSMMASSVTRRDINIHI